MTTPSDHAPAPVSSPDANRRPVAGDDPAPGDGSAGDRGRRLLVQPEEVRALTRKFSHRVDSLFAPKLVVSIVGVRGPGAAMALRLRRWMAADRRFPSPEAIPLAGVDPETGAITPPIELAGREVLLVDATISTGRTAQAAVAAILAAARAAGGTPAKVRLVCLVDAGGREVPIQPDAIGMEAPRGAGERARVRLKPLHPEDEVAIERGAE